MVMKLIGMQEKAPKPSAFEDLVSENQKENQSRDDFESDESEFVQNA